MQKSQHTQFLRILIISFLLVFSLLFSACSTESLEKDKIDVVFVNGKFSEYRSNELYIKVCLNLSNYKRVDVAEFNLGGNSKGVLAVDEFLFFINSSSDYPNLGVIAKNGECFFLNKFMKQKGFG